MSSDNSKRNLIFWFKTRELVIYISKDDYYLINFFRKVQNNIPLWKYTIFNQREKRFIDYYVELKIKGKETNKED